MRLNCFSFSHVPLAFAAQLLALLVLPVAAFGQEAGQAGFATPLRAGARALQFQITQDFTLSSFQGSTLSYKLQHSATTAFRLGVSMSGSGSDTDIDGSYTQDTLRVDRAGQGEQSAFYVALAIQMLRNRGSGSRVVPFVGLGPGASFSRAHRKSWSSESELRQDESTTHQTQAWIQGLAGVEWFASRQVSFHAEYGLRLGYEWRHLSTAASRQQNDNGSVHHSDLTSEEDESGWFLGDGSVLFGLSVYF
jgi:hypothetical protein